MKDPETSPGAGQAFRALLIALALILMLTWQISLLTTPEGEAINPVPAVVALTLFVWAMVREPPARLVGPIARWLPSRSILCVLVALCCSLMAVALSTAHEKMGYTHFFDALLLWLAGAVVFFAGFAPRLRAPRDWRAWLRAHRVELLVIACITLVAAALRLYRLGLLPQVVDGDAGLIGMTALATPDLPLANPFGLWENFGSLYLQGVKLCIDLFGHTALALRLLPAISGILSVPALFLLGRRMFGTRVGLYAAGLLAVSHLHLHFSRVAPVGYIHATFLVPIELYFFLSGLEDRSAWRLALGGLVLGLHFTVYLTVQVIVAFLLVYLLIAFWLCRPLVRGAARQIPVFWLGALVTALPILGYAARQPDEFMNRLNASGTFQSGWLQQEMIATGKNAVQLLYERVEHALLSLNHYRAYDFYGSSYPVLDYAVAILFVLGVGCALWRTRDHRYLLLNGYFWSVTIALAVFATPPSADSYRLLAAMPAVALLAAIGLDCLIHGLALDIPERRAARAALVGGVAVLVAALNLQAYFVDFATNCRQGLDAQTRFAHYLGAYLAPLEYGTEVYLLSDDVYRYGTHSSTDYLSGRFPVMNVPDPVGALTPRSGTVIIAPPTRADELLEWAQAHPGGEIVRQVDCETLMLTAYRLP